MNNPSPKKIIHLINNSNKEAGGAQKILWSIHNEMEETSSILSFKEYTDLNSKKTLKKFMWPFYLATRLSRKSTIIIHHRFFLLLCPILNIVGYNTIFLCHNIFPNKNILTKIFKAKESIAISVATQDYLKKLGYKKIKLIENFIEAKPEDIKNQPSPPSEFIRIAYIGRLAYQKGVDTLLQAHSKIITEHNNIETHIIGDGPLLNSLKSFVEERKLNSSVIFHGSSSTPFAICKEFEIIVIPSRWEGFGLVFFESIAHRHFVIASDLEAFNLDEKLNEQVVLFKPGSAEDLKEKIHSSIKTRAYMKYKTHDKLVLHRFSKKDQLSKYKDFLNQPENET